MRKLDPFISKPVSIAPLVTFRILFGLIMLISIIRFAGNGWIYEFYILPKFHFTFYGFEWIKPLPAAGMYMVFALMGLSSLFILLGFFYRFASVAFFLLFTYVELIDKTFYLNHYYFISIVSFLMIWVPAHRSHSLDVKFRITHRATFVPAWTINVLKLQLGIVYFYAGLAKINPDWLLEALPLKIWLPSKTHLPIIGNLFSYVWVAYVFSWMGMLYDLLVPFALLKSKTRPVAYVAVIFFHLMTWILFPIGMFPFIMIALTLIFFSANFHEKILSFFSGKPFLQTAEHSRLGLRNGLAFVLVAHFAFQFLFPFRYVLFPGHLFWTEQGYRFSWRVMLMEKAGMCNFYIKNEESETPIVVNNADHLTYLQERMMATQPDMILQFAHYLKENYPSEAKTPEVYVESRVTLQGERSRPFIDPSANLAEIERSWKPKNWILPFEKAN